MNTWDTKLPDCEKTSIPFTDWEAHIAKDMTILCCNGLLISLGITLGIYLFLRQGMIPFFKISNFFPSGISRLSDYSIWARRYAW